MKKLWLVPLCICVIAGMVMSGCGTSDIVNLPAAITFLTLTEPYSNDIQFDFTYGDNPDVTGTFLVDYIAVADFATDSWIEAIVVDSVGDPSDGWMDRG